ncbi:MAG: hypothetical protein ACKVYV_14245 [Limisphaerales bacterium]
MNAETDEPTPAELAEQALDIAQRLALWAESDLRHLKDLIRSQTKYQHGLKRSARAYMVQCKIEGVLDAVEYALDFLEGGQP